MALSCAVEYLHEIEYPETDHHGRAQRRIRDIVIALDYFASKKEGYL
jgi:hypothetical protein